MTTTLIILACIGVGMALGYGLGRDAAAVNQVRVKIKSALTGRVFADGEHAAAQCWCVEFPDLQPPCHCLCHDRRNR